MALSLLIFDVTGSGLGVAGVVAAEIVPVLLLVPLAGAVVDRAGAVRVMVAADLVRVALAALLPLLASSPPAIYTVAFAMSGAAVFFNPAAGAVLPALVEDAELVAANSGIWSAAVLSQIVLAPVAGLVVATAGYTPAFLVNAASFAASAFLLLGLRPPHPPRDAAPPTAWAAMVREGITVVMRAAIAGGRASGDTRCRRMQRRGYPMADRLVRPQQGKMIAGVCAGLSQRFGIDVTLLRILFVVFALVGAAEIIYIILWIVVPKE